MMHWNPDDFSEYSESPQEIPYARHFPEVWLGWYFRRYLYRGLLIHFWLAVCCRVGGVTLHPRNGACACDEVERDTCWGDDLHSFAWCRCIHAPDAQKCQR